jgi:Uma2 family endonuclease
MATVTTRRRPARDPGEPGRFKTMGEVLEALGGVPAHRVRLQPAPGTATERDVIEAYDRERRRCELVDGVLVEKDRMGYGESRLAWQLGFFLTTFLQGHDLGQVAGEQAAIRLLPGLVRFPDVLFVSWARGPKGKNRQKPIPDLAPDLAVEVLSKSNTRKEVDRKIGEYFRAGVRLVWIVDPRKRTVRVYTAPERSTLLNEGDRLDGGDVLPGFRLAIREWFAEAMRTGPRRR